MSTLNDSEMHIEHDAAKRDAAMENEKELVGRAFSRMRAWQHVVLGYTSGICDGAPLDADKMNGYKASAKKAAEEYERTFTFCSRRAARIDFINAALAAGKKDSEIQSMLVPANECHTEHGATSIFKALVVTLGGSMTDLSVRTPWMVPARD
jgi:hypothetical protein